MKKHKPRTRRALIMAVVLLLGCAICAAIDYWAYPYNASIGGPNLNQGENGLWLRYTWYFGQHTKADLQHLARQLQDRQIRYAYFHVRQIGKGGKLAFHYAAKAKLLTDGLHRASPNVKLLAWVYVSDTPPDRAVHLADVKTRKAMVEEAEWLVRDCGFDGVQWDVEPAPNGDAGLLALLQETRAALPRGKLLSVASPMWEPAPLRRFGWSDTYFLQVSRACDQIVVMCYDSGFYMPRAYVWLVRHQAMHVTRDVSNGNSKCRVLLGLPTYGDGLRSHNPRAENLTNALRGVREGLADPAADASVFAGVALFAEYTTSTTDWDLYRLEWTATFGKDGQQPGTPPQ